MAIKTKVKLIKNVPKEKTHCMPFASWANAKRVSVKSALQKRENRLNETVTKHKPQKDEKSFTQSIEIWCKSVTT